MAMLYEALLDHLKLVGSHPYRSYLDLWMIDTRYHYECITIYSDDLLSLSNNSTRIIRGLNTLFPLKLVGDPELYLCGDVVTAEINGEVTHAFPDRTCINNLSGNIEKLFGTTLKNCGLAPEVGYHLEVGISDLLVVYELSR